MDLIGLDCVGLYWISAAYSRISRHTKLTLNSRQVARLILGRPAAFAAWRAELAEVCGRILKMREMLFAELKAQGVPGSWDHVM